MSSSVSPRKLEQASVRALLAGLVLLAAFAGYLAFLSDVRAVRGWLFLKLAVIWGHDLYLTIACASFGMRFVERHCRMHNLPSLEKLAFALPCGLVAFVAGMYFGGFLGWYGPTFAVLLPTALLVYGAPVALPSLQLSLRSRELGHVPALSNLAATSFGIIGVGIVYLGLLTPDAVNYDASWNHLVIAQDYARAGRIVPLIGDWVKNVPHLGSIVNTWAFIVPGLDSPPLRWMQALHNEFTTFLWSLVAIAAGVRMLAERPRARAGWAAIFLFPSLLVYDGNMGAAADHYLALFAVPVLLAGFRLLEVMTWRRALLLGWLAGGALLTKLHAVYVLIPLSLAIGARVAWLLAQRIRNPRDTRIGPAIRALVVGGLTATALLALHFGKNAYFYRNPFYPMAQGTFPSEPTLPDAQLQMDYLFADWHWHAPKLLSERLRAAATMAFTFSFKPHYTFNGDVPVFGSLFTLLTPAVLFLKGARRLALASAIMTAAVFTWAMTFWVDRSLQTFMPALAVVTGALIVRLWELGPLARLPLMAVVGLQVVWGADNYFSGSDRIASSISLIRSGMDGHAETRFDSYRREYRELGASLPESALVMLHNNHIMLGIDRPVLLDWAGYQAVFDYRRYKTPLQLHERLVQLGVSHVVYVPGSRTAPTKQEEVIFAAYATLNNADTQRFAHLRVFPVAKPPPKLARPISVLVWNLRNYDNGVYPVEALSSNEEMPSDKQFRPTPATALATGGDASRALDQVDAIIVRSDSSLPKELRDAVRDKFTKAQVHSSLDVYLRKATGLVTLEPGK